MRKTHKITPQRGKCMNNRQNFGYRQFNPLQMTLLLLAVLALFNAQSIQAKSWHSPISLRNVPMAVPKIGFGQINNVKTAMDGQGNAAVVWNEEYYDDNVNQYTKNMILVSTRSTVGVWSAPKVLADVKYIPDTRLFNLSPASLSYGTNGALSVTWITNAGHWLAEKLPGQAWSTSKLNSPIEISDPFGGWTTGEFIMNKNSEAMLVWLDDSKMVSNLCRSFTTIKYIRRNTSGTWSQPAVLTSKPGGVSVLDMKLTDNGQAVVLWDEYINLHPISPRLVQCYPDTTNTNLARQNRGISIWQGATIKPSISGTRTYTGKKLLVDATGHAGVIYDGRFSPNLGNIKVVTQASAGKPFSQPTTLLQSFYTSNIYNLYGIGNDMAGNVTLLQSIPYTHVNVDSVTGNLASNQWSASNNPISSTSMQNVIGKFALADNNSAITAGISYITGIDSTTKVINASIRNIPGNIWTLPTQVSAVVSSNANVRSYDIKDVQIGTNGQAMVVFEDFSADATSTKLSRVLKVSYFN